MIQRRPVLVANTSVLFRALLTIAWLTLGGTAAAGLSASPNPNSGDYTVSWSAISQATGYWLYESTDGGTTWDTSYYAWSTGKTFTNKPLGTYTYKLKYCKERFIGGEWVEICIYESGFPNVSVTANGIMPHPIEVPADTVGTTPYFIDVGTDGDAVISIPIDIIPGVEGFKPSLSLEYDSGRGVDRLEQSLPEDNVGYGWRVTGLSQIRRCVVNQSSGASINLTNSDSLCLDGMPLVLASGTHFAVGAIYRTLIESYAKIEIKGTTGAIWFKATYPDGTVREYGTSQAVHQGGANYQWSLDKETNADSVVVDYTYYFDTTNGINYIVGIDYTDAKVKFNYRTRTDAAAVLIGSASQTQSVFLHTIQIRYDDKNIREYRLIDDVVDGRRRLELIQQCGYDEPGLTPKCLAPLEFDWLTPTSTMAGVPILVDGMSDGLSNVHQIEYGTITGSSHPFLFTERPFGNGTLPSDTQLLSGSGALRHVATKLRRDNGLGGFHDTTYAYQNKGVESTKHWGFLGFYAQRIKDVQTGIVTYIQYRMDYPYFGQVAHLHQLDDAFGSHSQTLTRTETDFAQQSISHSAGTSVYPYQSASIDFIYEGSTQLGASQTTSALTFSSGFISQVVRTSETGTGVSTGSSGGTWGDIPTYTLSDLENTTETTVDFNNRTTSYWLVGFPDAVTRESWPGAKSGAGIVQDVTLSPHWNTLRPDTITQFPNDANLTLTTTYWYTTFGWLSSWGVSGDNVSYRNTSITSRVDGRYIGQIVNPKGHTTTRDYDSRFGTVKTKGDPNGRNTTWVRDEFGRVTSVTNGDGVETTTDYFDCPTGCGVLAYGVSPSYYTETDSLVSPLRRTYFDSLGRPIRSETESFTGTSFSKQDVKYDTQGRIEKISMPYFSGTPNDVIPNYDIRDRIEHVTRPDGSNTGTDYSVDGSTVVVTVTDNVKNADGTSADTQVKRSEYNILGQLVSTSDGYGTSTNPSTTYTYDANGNVLTATVDGGAAGSTTTTFEYDAAGNQKKIIGPDIGTVTTTYTGLNEVRTQTDNKGQLSTYNYDVLGRLEQLVNADGTSTWTWDTATNGLGKLALRSSPGFTETYGYDAASRLDSIVTNITPIGGSTGTDHTTSHTYDTDGRPLDTTYPGGFVLTRAYNARGYVSQLKDGATAIQTINDLNAFGNSIDESYANGVGTLRAFDPETGRLTDVNTTNGSTVFQDNDYAWRSNGTLESRIANPAYGLSATRKESYVYDVLNRVTLAETYINSSNTRDLVNGYDQLGNITSKTSTLTGDTDVTGYGYGVNAGPHAVTSATIDGTGYMLDYDDNGAVTQYDIAGTSDDKWIAYNAFNQPTKIVVGSGLDDTTPVAKDEFAYDPNGQRYARKTSWQEDSNTITEEVTYVGAVEIIADDSTGSTQTITKTRLSPNVMHVKIEGSGTEEFFEYAHRDHLGSIEVVTDDNGNVLDNLAFEPFGSRKQKDWTGNISSTELDALLDLASNHARKARGFTGHEHLDRTGFVHMNGRVYDPVLGRFLSPDPFVPRPFEAQSFNRYSYVVNSPLSRIDPSGFGDVDFAVFRDEGGDSGGSRGGRGLGDTFMPGDYSIDRGDTSRNERGAGRDPLGGQNSQLGQLSFDKEISQPDEPTLLDKESIICSGGCSLTSGSTGVGIMAFVGVSGEAGTTILVDQTTGLIHVFTYKGGGFGLGTPSLFVGLEKGLISETSISDLVGFGYSVNGIAAWNVGITGQVAAPADSDNYYAGSGTISASVGGVVGWGGNVTGLGTWTKYRGTYRVNQAPRDVLELLKRVDK